MSHNNKITRKRKESKMCADDFSNTPTHKRAPLKFDLATEIGVITDIERDGIESLHPDNAQEEELVEKLRELQNKGKLGEYKKTLQARLHLR